MAAAVEPALGKIELHKKFKGFGAWVKARHYDVCDSRTLLLPGALRHFDLPDLRKWLGKRCENN
jgi:hypothetical protein